MKKQWADCNKPHRLTLQLLAAAGVKAFNGRKPTVDFFRVYRFFKKLDAEVLDLFHEYLDATEDHKGLTMKELFYNAQAWNQKQRTTKIKETHVEDYLALLENW